RGGYSCASQSSNAAGAHILELLTGTDGARRVAMCEAAVKAIEFALSLDSGDTRCFLNMWMQGDFPEIREIWPEAPVEIYIGADSLHPETIAQENRIKKAAAPIAHRTVRRNAQGQWAREGRYWLDGSPDERLVQ